MACPPVGGDNPQALASGLSYVQVDKHGMSIIYHLHQCSSCTSQDILFGLEKAVFLWQVMNNRLVMKKGRGPLYLYFISLQSPHKLMDLAHCLYLLQPLKCYVKLLMNSSIKQFHSFLTSCFSSYWQTKKY